MSRYFDNATTIEKAKEACRIAREHDTSARAISFLKDIRKDNRSFWNEFLVSDFADAALDVIGAEKYTGSKEETLRLIESELVFS